MARPVPQPVGLDAQGERLVRLRLTLVRPLLLRPFGSRAHDPANLQQQRVVGMAGIVRWIRGWSGPRILVTQLMPESGLGPLAIARMHARLRRTMRLSQRHPRRTRRSGHEFAPARRHEHAHHLAATLGLHLASSKSARTASGFGGGLQ